VLDGASKRIVYSSVNVLACEASDKVQGFDRVIYNTDENLRLALTHLVQVIGGAAAHLDIPGQQIIGMRHKIVYDYLCVHEDGVW